MENSTVLEDVKTYLSITDNAQDKLLNLIIKNTSKGLLSRARRYDSTLTSLPDTLDYIVTEVAVIRFNRIGAEGMSEESVEGHTMKFLQSDFDAFDDDLFGIFNDDEGQVYRKGSVQFL